jgi:di-trans,poly-cis-decaprenylcistransferase
MDGNGRWAKARGKDRTFGHQNGRKPVREAVEAALELGIEYLTLYTFSTENWRRPRTEVTMLLELLSNTLQEEIAELIEQGVRFNVIGDLAGLPDLLSKGLRKAMRDSEKGSKLVLTLALNYGGRQELLHACRELVHEAELGNFRGADVTEESIEKHLYTKGMPDPELVIRTSGEQRISNFLLWQIAYAELLFLPILWPDFRKDDFFAAVSDYKNRKRRFGGV